MSAYRAGMTGLIALAVPGALPAQAEPESCASWVQAIAEPASSIADRRNAVSSLVACPVSGPPALVRLWHEAGPAELTGHLATISSRLQDDRILAMLLTRLGPEAPRSTRQAALAAAVGFYSSRITISYAPNVALERGDSIGSVWVGSTSLPTHDGAVPVRVNAPDIVLEAIRTMAAPQEPDPIMRSIASRLLQRLPGLKAALENR